MITNKWIMGNGNLAEVEALRTAENRPLDDNDALAMHLVIYDDGAPAATGRVYHDGRYFRIGEYFVKQDKRGQGFGDLLIKLLILKAFEFAPSEVRTSLCNNEASFLERYGFDIAEGETRELRLTKESMVFPSKCGHEKRYGDFFDGPG